MAAMELLCCSLGLNPGGKLSKEEALILEAELFVCICKRLTDMFRIQQKSYFRLIKLDPEKENHMLDTTFIHCLINDILSSKEYTIEGIAHYTQTPEDVIFDLASGCNITPSLILSRKIIELHKSVRPLLYQEIVKKFTEGQQK